MAADPITDVGRSARRAARRRSGGALALPGLAVILVIAVLLPGPAHGQCVMCGLSAEQASDPDTVSRTFNAAVLILLVPLLGLIGGLAGVTWKMRHWHGAVQEPDDPPPPGDP